MKGHLPVPFLVAVLSGWTPGWSQLFYSLLGTLVCCAFRHPGIWLGAGLVYMGVFSSLPRKLERSSPYSLRVEDCPAVCGDHGSITWQGEEAAVGVARDHSASIRPMRRILPWAGLEGVPPSKVYFLWPLGHFVLSFPLSSVGPQVLWLLVSDSKQGLTSLSDVKCSGQSDVILLKPPGGLFL